mgnify:CR=1 FL=1
MLKPPKSRGVALATATLGLTLSSFSLTTYAAFLEDSRAFLEARNFYMNRDFRQPNASQNYRGEWAQGFILKYESGFTDGIVGLGLDAIGTWGIRLDSGRGRSGTDLLPVYANGDVPGQYGSWGATAKARISKTTIRYGTLIPKTMPILEPSDSRLLPQWFRGLQLTTQEIKNLNVDAGRLTMNKQRNWDREEKLTAVNRGMTGLTNTNQFDFVNASYKLTKDLTFGYSFANLDKNYTQHYFTILHMLPITETQSLKTDLRLSRAYNDGNTNIDNWSMQGMFTYKIGGHSIAAAVQKMAGKTGFTYVNGTNPWLVNYIQIQDFANPRERSWQLRYDYDFAAMGVPGLIFMTRYVKGWDFERSVGGPANGREWERNTDIAYVFQNGLLKNLSLRWRNATVRSNDNGSDIDENRFIVGYKISLL